MGKIIGRITLSAACSLASYLAVKAYQGKIEGKEQIIINSVKNRLKSIFKKQSKSEGS